MDTKIDTDRIGGTDEHRELGLPAGSAARIRMSRRSFLRYGGTLGGLVGLDAMIPGPARAAIAPNARREPEVIDGGQGPVELTIGRTPFEVDGRRTRATTINGTVPGPLLRYREGDEAVIHVRNELDEETSIHWHGLILPAPMDGVPEVSFPGIAPGEAFTYRFPIRQHGTYWYHSHSGFQEQLGHYGAFVIDPAGEEAPAFDRDYVVLLSDWSFEDPHRIMARLKKMPDYYNRGQRTVVDFIRDVARDGLGGTVADRLEWGAMRMNPTDMADITGTTYTYLMNGTSPEGNWTGLFQPGERVRLRFINAAASTFFDIRVPGLPMNVVQVSGQNVKPVETDELRIGVAERYDVIVEPEKERAYTVFAEAMDRSGYARGTLAPREGMEAVVPGRRERPLRTMADMGMEHGGSGEGVMEMTGAAGAAAGMPSNGADRMPHDGVHGIPGDGQDGSSTDLRPPGSIPEPSAHGEDGHGPGEAGIPPMVRSRLHEPGVGLGEDGRRVLVYTDLEALDEKPEFRAPDRELELHLTGNMERFMWSIDGVKFSDAEPIEFEYGERIRLTMINDTMMEHPMHLHGMFMELENGRGRSIPLVDTVIVKPAEKLSVLVTADAPGPWAFHCHLFYHMEAGMFRVVRVGRPENFPESFGEGSR